MGRTRVLLLNIDAGPCLLGSLEEMLRNANPYGFEVQQQLVHEGVTAHGDEPDAPEPSEFRPHLVLLCLSGDSLERACTTLGLLCQRLNGIPVVLVMESGDCTGLYELLKRGAADFLISPVRATDLIPRLLRLHQQTLDEVTPARRLKETLGLQQIVGESETLLQEIRKIPKIARCDATVLISGETGTGKELFARAIHYLSPRSSKSFIPVNCGAIPLELVENELFGHESGAFTGAVGSAHGLIRESDGGTLFLDEVDSLPFTSQVKLLRFLQDKEYRPLGSRKSYKADVRIVSAANASFDEAIGSARFRSDLFYRLNVISVSLPPLRRRREDIPLLARHLAAKYSAEYLRETRSLSEQAVSKLLDYDWPGNVRELENVIACAVVLSERATVQAEDIHLPVPAAKHGQLSFKALKAKAVAEFETAYIRRLLTENSGNITKAAGAAKKNRRAFWQLMRKHHIQPPTAFPAHDSPGQIIARGRTNLS